jgi:hypothetical protein
MQNLLAGEPDPELEALAERLSAQLAALKVEVAPEPVLRPVD